MRLVHSFRSGEDSRIYAVSSISVSPSSDSATRRKIADRMRSGAIGCDATRDTAFSLSLQLHLDRAASYLIWTRKATDSLPTSARRRYLIGKQLAATLSRRRIRWRRWRRRRKPNKYVSREHLWPASRILFTTLSYLSLSPSSSWQVARSPISLQWEQHRTSSAGANRQRTFLVQNHCHHRHHRCRETTENPTSTLKCSI